MENSRSVLLASSKNAELIQLNEEQSKQLKVLLLEMYKDIFTFCEENHINVMLGGGSVLGSVRHGGFIPWDDDIDLIMSRKDYEKFSCEFEKSMGNKYELFVPDGKHKISHLFMKVSKKGTILEDIYTAGCKVKTGVAIDIFPIENVPEKVFLRRIKGFVANVFAYTAVSVYMFQNRSMHLKNAYQGTWKGRLNYTVRNILGMLFSFRCYEKWYLSFDRFVQTQSEGSYCTIPTGRMHYEGEHHKREVFFPIRQATFEDICVYVPNKAEIYLERLYGDFMKIPPKEKRERHFYTEIKF